VNDVVVFAVEVVVLEMGDVALRNAALAKR
jgi:hypothetical protein